ncbi:MAG: SDR family NAD(P)-dependent oxidoreductase [Caulobacteraceae bacterium]|nr:SDR family NAD(P)-dependent oxidoreductase [Caulobacteraceae bacterium]
MVTHGAVWEQSLDDWRWTLGVNLWGVIHCLKAFLPMMLEHRQEGHVTITASMAGLAGNSSSAYTASKFALVGVAEGLAKELADTPLGVSVLCPGGVNTRIMESETLRPEVFPERGFIAPQMAQNIAALASPDRTDRAAPEMIADLVLGAISEGRLYVLPMQARYKAAISARLRTVQEALDQSPTTAA